jgi:hypothetical protein
MWSFRTMNFEYRSWDRGVGDSGEYEGQFGSHYGAAEAVYKEVEAKSHLVVYTCSASVLEDLRGAVPVLGSL